jgi:thiol:disulfide interchange protein DsbA
MKFRFAFLLFALLPLAAFASADAPVQGQDYELIANGQPFEPLNGKVEVVEVFSYACIHCAHFQPLVDEWKKTLPAQVRFTPVAATLNTAWLPYARAYYTSMNLGVLPRTHDAVFKALHEEGSLPKQNASANEIAPFYATYGIEPAAFVDEFFSKRVDEQLKQSEKFVMRTEAFSTPMIIINGKYRVLGKTPEEVLQITSALVKRELAAQK